MVRVIYNPCAILSPDSSVDLEKIKIKKANVEKLSFKLTYVVGKPWKNHSHIFIQSIHFRSPNLENWQILFGIPDSYPRAGI